jgi:tRNA nucleotidyltransferase (CCA-adding enzyme)
MLPVERLGEAMRAAYPELAPVGEAASDPVYLVGGAVRDLLLGRGRADVDLVVEGEAEALAVALGVEPYADHDRFGTLKVELDGHEVDIATARSESYPEPGALPVVERGASLEADLGRRDFTVNAMAVPLAGEPRLLDPHGGLADLDEGLLRVLHRASFEDDPTRAIRAARYAARLGLALEAETEELLRATDPGTVSADRWRAELRRLASEPTAAPGFETLAGWGAVKLGARWEVLAAALPELLARSPWAGEVEWADAWLAAAFGPEELGEGLAGSHPTKPSGAVSLARGHGPVELLLARALGAEWLDDYMGVWRDVALEIDGADLIAAGVPEGPALGRGLTAALRAKLDGEVHGREQELAAAVAAAEQSRGSEPGG